MKITFRKMFREMWFYKGRTFLTIIGILVGVASLGAVLTSYSILNREMNYNFMMTNPSSMVFKISNMDDSIISVINNAYKNTEVEIGKTVQARISRGDGTYGTIYLRSISDFNNQKIDTFTLENGVYPQNSTEMVLERDSLKILKNLSSGVNETVNISLPGEKEAAIKLSGIVFAPGLAPASMENYSYGFISLDGLKQLGYSGWYDELRIVSYDNRFNKEYIDNMSVQIKDLLTQNGYNVESVKVSIPGEHPHIDQLKSFLFLLQAFSIVALFAASLIIINLINFIMSKQRKQIAIMKTLGATTFDIALPFLLYVFIISIVGILLGIPLGILAGGGYSKFAAEILNFKIYNNISPLWVFIVQILVGVFIPLISTITPILKNAGMEIKDGLSETIGAAIGINVSERKRELGVLRAIGVNNSQIVTMVLIEVLLMGALSWIIGAVLSYPLSVVIGNYFGQIFLYSNLQNVISISGVFKWGIIAITASLISGFIPAQKVAKAPLMDMLNYE